MQQFDIKHYTSRSTTVPHFYKCISLRDTPYNAINVIYFKTVWNSYQSASDINCVEVRNERFRSLSGFSNGKHGGIHISNSRQTVSILKWNTDKKLICVSSAFDSDDKSWSRFLTFINVMLHYLIYTYIICFYLIKEWVHIRRYQVKPSMIFISFETPLYTAFQPWKF